jgi:hypothetical protein
MLCKCERCRHTWVKRIEERPVRCPKCKQPNWDVKAGVLRMGRPPEASGRTKKKAEK